MNKIIMTVIVFFTLPISFGWAADNAKLCEAYNNTYTEANKNLAMITADGISDNSAPRETNRQLETLNQRTLQLMLIQQMEAHGCRVPKLISTGGGYLGNALACSLKSYDSPECDRQKWKSSRDDLEHFK